LVFGWIGHDIVCMHVSLTFSCRVPVPRKTLVATSTLPFGSPSLTDGQVFFRVAFLLPTREHDPSNRDHVHFFNDLPDHDKRILSNLAIRGDVVGTKVIEFIDLLARNELLNLDSSRSPAQLLRVLVGDLDVLSLPYLVSIYDLVGRHLTARAFIDLAIPDAVACFAIDLMEADFLAFARGRDKIGQDTSERRR
jgi:hypothetical protein